jgi:putative transposase
MARRQVVGFVQGGFDVSRRRACDALGAARSSVRYVSVRGDDPIREPLRALAARRPRYGYRRLTVLLRREGWRVNPKRVYRLYRLDDLAVRRKKRKRLAAGARRPLPAPTQAHVRWSMDFTTDTLATGRPFRTLNIVDDGSRECPAIVVDHGISGARITRELDHLAETRPLESVL